MQLYDRLKRVLPAAARQPGRRMPAAGNPLTRSETPPRA